jgi:flagellar basal-body rod protein FlgF
MENVASIALSRLAAQQREIDVIAGNLANAATPGFRAERVLFSDYLVRSAGAAPGTATIAFAQDRATYRTTAPGPLRQTTAPLDLALGGDGYFTVQTPRGVRLTRAGHFGLSATGGIVDDAGDALLDANGQPLQLAATDTAITIAADGTVSSENGQIGKIAVAQPDNDAALREEGGQLFDPSATTTAPVAAPKIVQGTIEDSNVVPTLELTRMISEEREFQFTSLLVQAESDRQQSAIDKIIPQQT